MAPDPSRRERIDILAQRLRELRAGRGWTQDQVADAIGCHESAVSRWESGGRVPGCADLLQLSQLFRVSADYLLGHSEQPALPGSVLVDQGLLDRLSKAATVDEFDALVDAAGDQAAWVPVPEGAVLVAIDEAMRRARAVANRFPDSRHADRLFRPRA